MICLFCGGKYDPVLGAVKHHDGCIVQTGCVHPVSHRVWTSNWQWGCLVCRYIEHVPEGAVGSVRKPA